MKKPSIKNQISYSFIHTSFNWEIEKQFELFIKTFHAWFTFESETKLFSKISVSYFSFIGNRIYQNGYVNIPPVEL